MCQQNLKPGFLLPSDIALTSSGGSQIKHHGTITIPSSYKGEITRASFYVTDIAGPAIIDLQTSPDLILIIFNFLIMKTLPRRATIRRNNPWKKQTVHDQ